MKITEDLDPCTDAEQLALERVAVMRTILGHSMGCPCQVCDEARVTWRGQLDELDRLVPTFERRDLEAMLLDPRLGIRPADGEAWDAVRTVCEVLRWFGGA